MKRISIISKVLKSVGYDEASGTLEVEFKNGGLYQYADVPADEYAALMLAPSKGTYFGDHIRDAYRFKRLE
jgi:hypothetical protein